MRFDYNIEHKNFEIYSEQNFTIFHSSVNNRNIVMTVFHRYKNCRDFRFVERKYLKTKKYADKLIFTLNIMSHEKNETIKRFLEAIKTKHIKLQNLEIIIKKLNEI
jgi:hypothetical protein